jgi:hypothetical protein
MERRDTRVTSFGRTPPRRRSWFKTLSLSSTKGYVLGSTWLLWRQELIHRVGCEEHLFLHGHVQVPGPAAASGGWMRGRLEGVRTRHLNRKRVTKRNTASGKLISIAPHDHRLAQSRSTPWCKLGSRNPPRTGASWLLCAVQV